MRFVRWIVYVAIRTGLRIACRIDAPDIDTVPGRGPLLLYTNHTGAVEVPLIYILLYPRPLTGWGKVESWRRASLHWLFLLWEAVPVRRGDADMAALKQALALIRRGFIFALAPEGTRNRTGRMNQARPGLVMLAQLSGAPILPIAKLAALLPEEYRGYYSDLEKGSGKYLQLLKGDLTP